MLQEVHAVPIEATKKATIQADFRLYKTTFLAQLQAKLLLKNVNCSCLFTNDFDDIFPLNRS
jgi:hypothetical protein